MGFKLFVKEHLNCMFRDVWPKESGEWSHNVICAPLMRIQSGESEHKHKKECK